MDLRQLRYFLQIVESGSLSRASEILRVAQPSLSVHLRSLEDQLGVTLLLRHPRGVTPTDFGTIFADHARTILREVDRSHEILHSYASNPVGKVSIGLPTSACRGLSLPVMEAVQSRFPGVSIHIIEAMTGNLDEWIQMGRLDVALLYDHRAFENVAWTEMIAEDLMLFVPPDSPLAERGSVRFGELAGVTLAVPGRPNVLRTLIERIAVRQEVVLTAMDCDSLAAIRQFVRSGYATVMPHFAMTEEIDRGEMVAIAIEDPSPSWRLSVVLSQRTLNRRASEMVALVLAEVIADLVEQGRWRARLRSSEKFSRANGIVPLAEDLPDGGGTPDAA